METNNNNHHSFGFWRLRVLVLVVLSFLGSTIQNNHPPAVSTCFFLFNRSQYYWEGSLVLSIVVVLQATSTRTILLLPVVSSFPLSSSSSSRQQPSLREQQQQQQQHTKKDTIRYRARVAYDGSQYNGFQHQGKEREINNKLVIEKDNHAKIGNQQPKNKKKKKNSNTLVRTIQGEIENALARRFNHNANKNDTTEDYCENEEESKNNSPIIRVVAAGRTDAGVHARGQAIHFDILQDIVNTQKLHQQENIQQLQYALNCMLPQDIRIWNISPVPSSSITNPNYDDSDEDSSSSLLYDNNNYKWNVMYETTKKLYSYRICIGPVMDPILRHNRWHIPDGKSINIPRLQHILNYYVGTHDFRAFAGAIEQNMKKQQKSKQQRNNNKVGDTTTTTTTTTTMNTVRTVYSVDLIQEDVVDVEFDNHNKAYYYRIDFVLKGALYKMVRNMVGTAIDVSREQQQRGEGEKKRTQGGLRRQLDEEEFVRLLHHEDENGNEGNDNPKQQLSATSKTQFTRKENPCKPAPAHGLTLEWVYYDDDNF